MTGWYSSPHTSHTTHHTPHTTHHTSHLTPHTSHFKKVCPITCEVITDAAATKFAPQRYYERQSLEEWVQASGTCPLTRRACTVLDILYCKTEMQARIRQRSAASLAARRPIDAAGGEHERSKWAQFTVTLQTTDWSIFAAMPKELIRQTMRQQLPVHVAKALATTGPTTGKSDFLFLNFVSVEAAREAIAHVNDALAGSVKFGDKTHKVKAELSSKVKAELSSFTFKASLLEVARAYLRDAFLLTQRPLTDAVITVFKKMFGADWNSKLKSYFGRSSQAFLDDDGRAVETCVRSLHFVDSVSAITAHIPLVIENASIF
jgi:hypothetical protein